GSNRSTGTEISFYLKNDSFSEINVYNTKGQKVRTVFKGDREKGLNTINWNGRDDNNRAVSSGVYLYQLKAEGKILTGKALLLK
ncbi:MAG: FlgD immunoglobulin-like domain containing protein, partial [Candidatus Cloacimonetes bacterium]|nr:FlgD immunoglobulin-like domain containing protein [Candidatus Cloacimonadota bacterium]